MNRVLSADCLPQSAVTLTKICNTSTTHVFQVNAKNVVFSNLPSIICNDVLMVKMLEPVNLMFQCFDFCLIKTLKRMHKLYFLHNKHLSCVYIHRRVHFTCYTLTYYLTLYPLNYFPLHLLPLNWLLFKEIILKSLFNK